MGFLRAKVFEKGLERPSRAGDGFLGNPVINTYATDAATTLTIPQVLGGVLQITGLTAGRNLTVPLGTDLAAAMPDMDIGDSYSFKVSITTAFAGTWVANTGVTLAGRATTPANTCTDVIVTKTGAATFTWTVL